MADRLQHCIRDLAALNALPSMCVGCSPDEALGIVLDALPTVLGCDLVYLQLPGTPHTEHGSRSGRPMTATELAELHAATPTDGDGSAPQLFLASGTAFVLEAEIPVGNERGRLLAGRGVPLDPETDRVLVRTAANIVGTIVASAKVLDAARRKDEFLAMLGHELRNPLAPILTAVELLRTNASANRERDVIERNTRHLARIVDDLLDISRVTRGHIELRREHVPLATVLERATELAAPLVARNRHTLHVARADGIMLQGDPVRLAQVFGNLLTNAAKFTPPGGRIDVLVGRSPDRARVTVRDNGAGIARDQLARIFEPFVQADRARDAQRGGLGLGLAIVRDLVHRHDGTVAVESAGPGRGAEFVVELPTATPIGRAAPVARTVRREARAGVRVLVVDDDVDLAELLSDALEDEGFSTSVAHDGADALAIWRDFHPHAGVLDVGLPDVDGYELAKSLRAEHGAGATLIAASGYGQPNDRARGTDAGFDCYLVKPVSIQDLVSVLDERVVPSS